MIPPIAVHRPVRAGARVLAARHRGVPVHRASSRRPDQVCRRRQRRRARCVRGADHPRPARGGRRAGRRLGDDRAVDTARRHHDGLRAGARPCRVEQQPHRVRAGLRRVHRHTRRGWHPLVPVGGSLTWWRSGGLRVRAAARVGDLQAEVAGHRREVGRTVSVTAPTGPVRGLFRARPWPARPPEPGAHGRIADGGSPESCLEARTRWSAGGDSGRAYGL
jgi:hypothetical protein